MSRKTTKKEFMQALELSLFDDDQEFSSDRECGGAKIIEEYDAHSLAFVEDVMSNDELKIDQINSRLKANFTEQLQLKLKVAIHW